MLAVGAGHGQLRDPDLARDRAVRRIAERPGVGPVAHEHGIAGLKHAAQLLLGVVEHALRRDVADPGRRQLERRRRLVVVDRDRAVLGHDLTAAEAVDPLQRIAGQALVGLRLKHEPLHLVVAGGALAVADLAGDLGQLLPRGGRLLAIFLEQILAVVQDPGIGEPGHRDQVTVDRVVRDDRREVLVDRRLIDVLGEIDEVTGQDARPDHVDLEDVDVGRVGGQDLLVQCQALGRRIGRGDDLDLVARGRGPGLGTFLAELQLRADRAAGNRDGGSRRTGRADRQSGRKQRHAIQPTAHRTPP